MAPLDLDVIQQSYGFTLSPTGQVLGLTSGDMGYEETGIVLDDETLKIWQEGVKSSDALTDTPNHSELQQHIESLHAENQRLKIALADAIRRPMGVVPNSAEGLVTNEELARAELRRSQTD